MTFCPFLSYEWEIARRVASSVLMLVVRIRLGLNQDVVNVAALTRSINAFLKRTRIIK
jgi:hypothetical protein